MFAGVLVADLGVASAQGDRHSRTTRSKRSTRTRRGRSSTSCRPAGNSIVGDDTGPWLQRHIHGSNFAESTLYVGLSLVALSLVALVAAVRRRLNARA